MNLMKQGESKRGLYYVVFAWVMNSTGLGMSLTNTYREYAKHQQKYEKKQHLWRSAFRRCKSNLLFFTQNPYYGTRECKRKRADDANCSE
jgi:hypothetical protein